ncbi:class II fructose-bisphosphatase [Niveibacterium terrae]|uniref:class II fructose-bisphosphatase n=1 Tax=Niveibacterium terrae TaxID=3373598 RepID=UPI003A8CC168
MRRELAIEFSRVTEAAALAGYKWLGRGDKNKADGAAVEAMRYVLNQTEIDGEIVIGEGEIDEAPMLYIGEHVGRGGDAVDIAVDPIDGTRMAAMGQNNAVAVLAVGDKGSFMRAPDMYMEKLIVGNGAKGAIHLDWPIADNVRSVAAALGKPLDQLTVVTLARPRHETAIRTMQQMGVRVYAIPDGDVAASVQTCMPESEIDMLYCIGGAPEGVISAAVARAMDGDMQGRLIPRDLTQGCTPENHAIAEREIARCWKMGIAVNSVLTLDQMALTDNVIVSVTGITKGDLTGAITRKGDLATTETLLIRGKTRTVRRIISTHYLSRKDELIRKLVL